MAVEAPVAPPPSAPAPAPQATAPAPSKPMTSEPKGTMEDAFSRFDQLATESSGAKIDAVPDHPYEKTRKAKEAKKTAPPAREDPKPAGEDTPAAEDTEEKPDAKPDEAVKPGEPQKPKKPSDFLREELQRQKSRAEAYEKELAALKAPKEDPEKKQLTERLTAAEKLANEREEELRFANYERSAEYRDKYFKPYVDAWAQARESIKSLDVVAETAKVIDPNTGEEVEKVVKPERPAQPEDFDVIALTPNDREARQLAKKMFGQDYMIAMQHREKVKELNKARESALNDYRTKGAEREKQLQETQAKARQEQQAMRDKIWNESNKEFAEKHKDWFEPADADEEFKKMMTNDMAVTDALFGDTSKIAPDRLIKLHSTMRNRAAMAGPLSYLLKQTRAKLAEAEAKLKGYEGSEPKEGQGVQERPESNGNGTMAGVDQYFDKIAKPATNFY